MCQPKQYSSVIIPASDDWNAIDKKYDGMTKKQIFFFLPIAAYLKNGYVKLIEWKRELGAPEHIDGYVQVSARPYRQGYGCDGTTDRNIHLIAMTLCKRLGIDYLDAYHRAYNGDRGYVRQEVIEWLEDISKDCSLIAETIIPKETNVDTLRLMLSDLYQINNKPLVDTLSDILVARGYDVTNFWEYENTLRSWKAEAWAASRNHPLIQRYH